MSKNVLNRKKKIQQAEEADDLSSTSSEDTIENKLPRPQNFIYAPSASSTLNLVEQSEEGKVRRRKRSSTSLLYNNDAEVVNTRRVKNRFLNIPNMEENKFIKPKGISLTSTKSGGYRVQLTKFQSKSDKFSRNAHRLLEAVWLYECAVLINDHPVELNNLLVSGNYHSIVSFNLVSSEYEYYQELGKWIKQFSTSNLLRQDEAKVAVQIYDQLTFRYKDKAGNDTFSKSLESKNETCMALSFPTKTSDVIELLESHPECLK